MSEAITVADGYSLEHRITCLGDVIVLHDLDNDRRQTFFRSTDNIMYTFLNELLMEREE